MHCLKLSQLPQNFHEKFDVIISYFFHNMLKINRQKRCLKCNEENVGRRTRTIGKGNAKYGSK